MNVSIEIGLLVSAFLIFCSILMSKTGYRFGIPTLLMFLLAGMLFGTDGLGIQFDDVSVAQHIGMVALCIILFTGGMDTKMEDIRPVLSPGVMLATSGLQALYQDNGQQIGHRVIAPAFEFQHRLKIMFQVDLLRTKDVEDGGGVGGRHRGGQ